MQDIIPDLPVSQREQESRGWRSGESARLPPSCAGSNQSVDAICGLSLLLVLSFAPRGFSPARSEKPDSICISVNFPKCATEGSFPSALLIPAGYIAHAQYNVQLPVTSPFLPS